MNLNGFTRINNTDALSLYEYGLLKHKGMIGIPQIPYFPRMSNLNMKDCKGTRHVIMRNGECTSKLYTLHEGVH